MPNPPLPPDFPVDFKHDFGVGATWRWYRHYGHPRGAILLQCREYPDIWSFEPASPDGAYRRIASYPVRDGKSWDEVKVDIVVGLLSQGSRQ